MIRQNNQTSQKQQQRLNLSIQQIQLLNFIQLGALELDQRIRDEVLENPVLESAESTEDNPLAALPETETDTDYDGLKAEESGDLMDQYLPDDDLPSFSASSEKSDLEPSTFASNQTEQEDFRLKLHQQLAMLPLTERQRMVAEYLIHSLDDDGYLRNDLDDLADDISFACNLFITDVEIKAQLETVQALEPAGIGARDLQECLHLQLEAKSQHTKGVQLACQIVRDHLNDLANRQTEFIAACLKVSESEVKESVDLIVKLTPRPAGGQASRMYKNLNILPEFSVDCVEGGTTLSASLINSKTPHLRLNKNFSSGATPRQKMTEQDTPIKPQEQYLKSKLDSAQWFMDMIRQREDSMLRTMEAILSLQPAYFATGDKMALKPMILKDVADIVEMDISTISRVTSAKYAQTPFGLVHLKSLFNQGMMTETGELVTNQEIQGQIERIVQEENRDEPFSDQEIAHKLGEDGYIIARRTVAKYRDALHIPAANLRQKK